MTHGGRTIRSQIRARSVAGQACLQGAFDEHGFGRIVQPGDSQLAIEGLGIGQVVICAGVVDRGAGLVGYCLQPRRGDRKLDLVYIKDLVVPGGPGDGEEDPLPAPLRKSWKHDLEMVTIPIVEGQQAGIGRKAPYCRPVWPRQRRRA